MTAPPTYFQAIQEAASNRWNQLEADPDLAGPWHQLFRQVQSPRHVVSELLQNADDAGATEAAVSIVSGDFVFTHNGEDFKQEHFSSLCKFGYSNKRTLHTIGFRGIGFKSTFSIGAAVELVTPTLGVRFDRSRFTQPHWIGVAGATAGITKIRVCIDDELRKKELEKNLEEWVGSAYSLLFFRHIRTLTIAGTRISWRDDGAGPVARSRWMTDAGSKVKCLTVSSEVAPFPPEALEEIRGERGVSEDQSVEFPPCSVEIVLGAPGRLFVVLPTGVLTKLPFACNAPFIQDPARMKIKDPEISPTNRWLLDRIGVLAGQTIADWVECADLSVSNRATAYQLLPNVDRNDSSLEGGCAAQVELAVESVIAERKILLAWDGLALPESKAVGIPRELFGIWSEDSASKIMDADGRPALSGAISAESIQKLSAWNLASVLTRQDLMARLAQIPVPKPDTLEQLVALHAFLHPEICSYWKNPAADGLRIFPAAGKVTLASARELVRLGEKKFLRTQDEWKFLSRFLLVLDSEWLDLFVLSTAGGKGAPAVQLSRERDQAKKVLEACSLDSASDTDEVIERVASALFVSGTVSLEDCISLAQIAARLGAKVSDSFRFVDRTVHLRGITDGCLADVDGQLEMLTPATLVASSFLHNDYTSRFRWCTSEEWNEWLRSGKAGLPSFFVPTKTLHRISGRKELEKECARRGVAEAPSSKFVRPSFVLDDFDFAVVLWDHWKECVAEGRLSWSEIGTLLLERLPKELMDSGQCTVRQYATTGNSSQLPGAQLPPGWLLRLRDLPCLKDKNGSPRKPAELFRRTPETEPLLDVEPFIDPRLDNDATRPLLDLLGVRSVPTGPERIVEFLQTLAKIPKISPTIVADACKWYARLDQMTTSLDTESMTTLRKAFDQERLILTNDEDWTTLNSVFIRADVDDVPGAQLVHGNTAHFNLWRRLGMAERPSADLAIAWLCALPLGSTVSSQDARRVRMIQSSVPRRVWHECGHWLALDGKWSPIGSLRYSTDDSGVVGLQLFQHVKGRIADMAKVAEEIRFSEPFSSLTPLRSALNEEIVGGRSLASPLTTPKWIERFSAMLALVKVVDDNGQADLQTVATRLRTSRWSVARKISLVPYIAGEAVGSSRTVDFAWIGDDFMHENLPAARLARRIPEEIGRQLGTSDLRDALKYSYERSPQAIEEYFRENFELREPSGVAEDKPIIGTKTDPESSLSRNGTTVTISTDTLESVKRLGKLESLPTKDSSPEPQKSDPKGGTGEILLPVEVSIANYDLMDIFAVSIGFQPIGRGSWKHPDGTRLEENAGSSFNWTKINGIGMTMMNYRVIDHCLEEKSLELKSEIWIQLERSPADHSMILRAPSGEPSVFTGQALLRLLKNDQLILHPASYRMELQQ